jgi:hypothetical protein
MTPIHFLALGFVLGTITTTLALLALVGRYKWENLRARSLHDAMEDKLKQSEWQRAVFTKKLIDSNAEIEYIKGEVNRLRDQKLEAWDVPGGL